MPLLLFFAFLAGFVTILAPCIWPLLPIILSTSITGTDHRKPLGITFGIMASFGFFTLTLSYLVHSFHFDPNVLRLVAVFVIAFLGITMIFPPFSRFVEGVVSRISSIFGQRSIKSGGFYSGFITGISLGIVWSPCAGPILAAIATLAATGQVTLSVVLVTISYVIGVGLPLFIFAFTGQRIFSKMRFISSKTRMIQQIFGLIMLLTAFAIYSNYDVYIQTKLLNTFPFFNSSIDSFETNNQLTQQLNILKGKMPTNPNYYKSTGLFNTDSKAPGFGGGTTWLNTSKPLHLQDLKGKVILVDFWTYTCINCIRTLPHVTSWYNEYKNDGFVVVGVHTPEFQFEHETANVKNAIHQFGISYPVLQDNNYTIWNRYNNQYWPAEYLIDSQGNIRRTDFGEGQYVQMEKAIRELLLESGHKIPAKMSDKPNLTPQVPLSPETYLGSYRMQYYYPNGNISPVKRTFVLNQNPPQDSFSLGGLWDISEHSAKAEKNATLTYTFYANNVYLVLNPGNASNEVIKVLLDGKTVNTDASGTDVVNGVVHVTGDRLYNLISLPGQPSTHTLQLEFSPGIKAFAFTFG